MRLFFNQTSPYARKVRVAVHELGLGNEIEPVEIDPWAEPPDLTGINPLSKVPTLVLADGVVVTESDTIIQVLHGLTSRSRLIPGDDTARRASLARAALCQGLIDAGFISVIEGRRPPPQRWPDWVARQERAVTRTLTVIERDFDLPAQRFDIGDIGLACALAYLDFRLSHLNWRDDRPKLASWFVPIDHRPSMIATRPC